MRTIKHITKPSPFIPMNKFRGFSETLVNNIKIGLIGILSLSCAEVAHADFRYVPLRALPFVASADIPAPTKPAADCTQSAPVVMSVHGSENTDLVSGFGSRLPLSIALHMILPKYSDWQIVKKSGVDMKTRVSWHANNEKWTDVLKGALGDAGLSADVSMDDKIIEIGGHPVSTCVAAPESAQPAQGRRIRRQNFPE